MQEDIMKIIEKNKRELPDWIAQFEIADLIANFEATFNFASFCKCLERMRNGNDLEFKFMTPNDDKRDKQSYLVILKKIDREDLIEFRKRFRRGTYIYKIK
jgi:hypothetical protein